MSAAAGATRGAAPRLATSAAALALALAGCGAGPVVGSQVGPTFTVGTLTFRVASAGVVRGAGELTLWLTDQPDTCLAIVATPSGTATYLSLRVAPPASGPTAAAVVAPKAFPAPGEALGRLERRQAGVPGAAYDTADGSLAWTANQDGSLALDAFDVGFSGAAERMTGGGLLLRPCN